MYYVKKADFLLSGLVYLGIPERFYLIITEILMQGFKSTETKGTIHEREQVILSTFQH